MSTIYLCGCTFGFVEFKKAFDKLETNAIISAMRNELIVQNVYI